MEKYISQIETVLNIISIAPIQRRTEVLGRYKNSGKAVAISFYENSDENNQKVVETVLAKGK